MVQHTIHRRPPMSTDYWHKHVPNNPSTHARHLMSYRGKILFDQAELPLTLATTVAAFIDIDAANAGDY